MKPTETAPLPREIRLTATQWKQLADAVAAWYTRDPLNQNSLRRTLLNLYQSWGYTEDDAVHSKLLAPLPPAEPRLQPRNP